VIVELSSEAKWRATVEFAFGLEGSWFKQAAQNLGFEKACEFGFKAEPIILCLKHLRKIFLIV